MAKTYFKKKPIRIRSMYKMEELKNKVLERDNYQCQNPYCENSSPISPPHHIKFRSRGGDDAEFNLVTVCMYCHDNIHKEWLNVSGTAPDNLEWEIK